MALADEREFSEWLNTVKAELRSEGVASNAVDTALRNAQFLPRVIELDRKQPEGRLTFSEYLEKQLVVSRINRGRELRVQHRAILDKVADSYGVPAEYIVALWGIETSYGANTGGFDVVSALATLAYEGRRAEYFRRELLQALRILEEGHVTPANMRGSWAGAMGQCQFMPSSFWNYAVDGNGDGKRNIWGSLPDVFSSAANYLRTEGWNGQIGWGIEVRMPPDLRSIGDQASMPYAEWVALGVKPVQANAVSPTAREPQSALSLVQPDGPAGRAFLVTANYAVIKHWNRSTYFATTVGLLADRIGRE